MEWSSFQTHGESADVAFEAMATQLFEKWCRTTYGDRVKHFYSLDGVGGDGGVEAFAVLDDGTEVGVQAKWFRESLDGSRAAKIRASLDQVRKRHPKLIRYIVCLPVDLKDAKAVSRRQTSGLDRWKMIADAVAKETPGLTVEYWGDSAITSRFAEQPDNSLEAFGSACIGCVTWTWSRSSRRSRPAFATATFRCFMSSAKSTVRSSSIFGPPRCAMGIWIA